MATTVQVLAVLMHFFGQFQGLGGKNILVLHAFASPSHHYIMSSIVNILAQRDHNVTHVTMYPGNRARANVNEIVLRGFESALHPFQQIAVKLGEARWVNYESVDQFRQQHISVCNKLFDLGLVQPWIESTIKFDLVIGDALLNECLMPLYELMGDAVILVNTANLWPWISDAMNVPTPFAYIPHQILPYTPNMNFGQRVVNSITWTGYLIFFRWFMNYVIDPYIHLKFPQSRTYYEAIANVSLVFANIDPVFTPSRPSMPNIIPIGGIHCQSPNVNLIPEELKNFMDTSTAFVVVSFGSIYNEAFMKEEKRKELIKAFSKLKQRVIWKSAVPVPNISTNVKVVDWLPQQDVLGHPKLCAVFNHGGLLSLQEALYNQVPSVSTSLFADQPSNMALAAELGITIPIHWTKLKADDVASAINRACFDPAIKATVRKYSSIFNDRPQSPSDNVVYWVEYVLRHRGSLHLRSSADRLSFVQYFLIDVIVVVFITLLAIIFSFILIFKNLRRFVLYFCNRKIIKLKLN